VHAGRDQDVLIREAKAADASAVAELLGQLGYPADAGAVESRLEALRVVGDRVVVAELEGRVVGLAHLQVSPALEYDRPAAKIAALAVDETHRSRGIGRALMEEMEREARARGCVLLYLTTAERRADAHAFYGRIGLEQTGRRYGKLL
jgi:GNAT superfamily N-acetyltransferase